MSKDFIFSRVAWQPEDDLDWNNELQVILKSAQNSIHNSSLGTQYGRCRNLLRVFGDNMAVCCRIALVVTVVTMDMLFALEHVCYRVVRRHQRRRRQSFSEDLETSHVIEAMYSNRKPGECDAMVPLPTSQLQPCNNQKYHPGIST